jgi:hypothetical protein
LISIATEDLGIINMCSLFTGIGSVRAASNRYDKDRTQAQRQKVSPEHIEKTAGPWKNYTDLNAWRRRPRHSDSTPYDPQKVTKLLGEIDFSTKDDMVSEVMIIVLR